MPAILEIIKTIVIGIIEGITEWLPVSSTGHMLLFDAFFPLDVTAEFKEMFLYVIQFAAIWAVILLFWKKMFPFQFKDKSAPVIRKDVFSIWFKVVLACVPGAVVTLLFDDFIEERLHNPYVIAAALILFGFAFLLVESRNKPRSPKIQTLSDISYQTALMIGLFQVFSIIPGVSRSGATIVGALLIGVSRVAAAEFTFFLAVPAMAGYSLLKMLKFGFSFSGGELFLLLLGSAVAFLVSLLAVKFLMGYVKKHDFKPFGWYRVALGVFVLVLFLFR